jgi:O-antigen/teichoic acid export membrane protein
VTGPSETPRPLSLVGHLKELAGHSAIYGSQDVAVQLINLGLTPLYLLVLTTADYGVIAILFTFSTVAKVVFRFGLDSGFFRIYYDLDSDDERERLSGTVALFAAAASSTLFVLVVVLAPLLLRLLGLAGAQARAPLLLAAADVYAGTFAFIPLHLLRIQGRARTFAAVNVARNLLNTILKVALVLGGFGVTGVLWSDFLATAALAAGLLPMLLRHARPAFSSRLLKEVLAFGLPKAPHGLMVQALNLADRVILVRFQPLSVVGIYDKAYSLGAGVKFGLTPFETAWQPFVLKRLRTPEAPRILAGVVTYAAAGFVALALGIALFGRELLMALTFTRPAFWAGAPVIPVVVLAYLMHGAFLLVSIGIGIEKRARYYPMITAAAAATNIGLDLVLIPAYGMMGAAWATVAGYLVMASLGGFISHRLYPIPLEGGRLMRIVLAAIACYALSRLAPEGLAAAIAVKAGLLAVFAASLVAIGVLRWPAGGIVEGTFITGERR